MAEIKEADMVKQRGRQTRRRGAAVVETAFVIPICLLFLLGIYEYGRFIMVRQLLDNAAREGARYAVVHTQGKTTLDVQNVVDQYLAGQGMQLDAYNKTVNIQVFLADPATGNPLDANGNVVAWTAAPFNNAAFGQAIAVQITGTYRPIIPALVAFNHGQLTIMPTTVSVQSTCIMYSETN
jgi:Flp pilus assembly protein TadG